MNWESMGGWIGGIIGVLGGLAGAGFGVWSSLRNCPGPRERASVWKAALQCGLLVAALLAGLFWLPAPYGFLLFIPYVMLLVVGIRRWNAEQSRIRAAETAERRDGGPPPASDGVAGGES